MRIRDRLILLFLLCLMSSTAFAQPSASLFRMINKEAREAKAMSRYAEAEEIYKKGISNQRISAADRATLVLNYVDLCFIRGDYTTAANLLDTFSPKTGEQSQRWTVRKATVNYFLGNFDAADTLYSEASLLDNLDNSTRYELLAFQGAMWMDRKMYSRALTYFEDALSLSTNENQVWNIRMEEVIPLAKTGNQEKALQQIEECITWFGKNLGNDSRSYQVSLRKKAEVLMLMDRNKDAVGAFHNYVNAEKQYALKNFQKKPEQWRLDFWKTLKPNISKVFALENDCPEFLLDVALFRREVALLGNADGGEMTKRLNRTGQQLRKALRAHEVAIDFVRYQKNDTARYGAILVPSLSMKGGIKFIPLWTEDELRGAKISKGAMVSMSLEDALCSNNMSDKDYLYTDSLLGRFVWDRLDSELEKYDYEDVYFAPEGLLHLLAIEYLREDNGVCMHRMTTLAHLLDRGKHGIVRKSRMLAAGGFDYNSTAQQLNNPTTQQLNNSSKHDAMEFLQSKTGGTEHPFAFLKGAKIEVDSIKGSCCFTTDTTTTQTEEQFKRAIQDKKYDVVHLSTHGYALDVQVPVVPEALCDSITEDRSLLASGVALTGANVAYRNSAAEDGIVSAREFCDMDMGDVDLIVLSACQTGLGRFSDEGPAGLVRGLKKAGSGALIVSLWSVDDEATMLFMKHLYKAIAEANGSGGTIDIHEAFNAARINFSKEAKVVQRFDRRKMKKSEREESYNLPRFCNSFILIDSII